MATFLGVLLAGSILLVGCGLIAWALFVWLAYFSENWATWFKVAHSVGAALLLAALIAWCIDSGLITTDNAAHCGPGTTYVSESHYNPATRSTVTDWMCVA